MIYPGYQFFSPETHLEKRLEVTEVLIHWTRCVASVDIVYSHSNDRGVSRARHSLFA